MHDMLEVIKNVESIYSTNSTLSVLKDFERVLDEMDLYVYKNWINGEVIEGPKVERHWITVSFMWPRKKMPDPNGAKRLLDYGCKIKYKKTVLVVPRKIKTPDDIRPGTKKGKLDHKPIWVVEITMPKKLVSDTFDGYMSRMKDDMGIGRNERVDASLAQPADQAQAAGGTATPPAPAAPAAPAGAA